nr:hypothetical protein [Tanacetum cinerariifolium]
EGGEQASASTPSEKATNGVGGSATGTQSQQRSASADDQAIVQTSQHPEWFSQPKKPPSPDQLMKGSCLSLTELEYHLEEVYKATTDQLDWVNPEGQQYHHNLLQPLPLIPDNQGRRFYGYAVNRESARDVYSKRRIIDITELQIMEWHDYKHLDWISFYGYAVNRESARDVYSRRRIIAVTEHQIMEWHDYKHLDWISVRRDDDQIYKFKEGDFKRLRLQDIEDMLLLLVQGKLSNLTAEERLAFNVSLRMFTRSIVIKRRVEDLQLGVESYQKKLNLTKPDAYRSDLRRREAYTAYSNPRGFTYQNKDKKNRLMRIDELHKFSDGTLNDVRNAFDDRLKGIRMQRPAHATKDHMILSSAAPISLEVAFCLGLRFPLEALRSVFKDLAFCLGSTVFCLQRSCILPWKHCVLTTSKILRFALEALLTSSTDSQMHNNIMAAGSRDSPPMLAIGRYQQWRSRFLRYIDIRPNGDALRKCILSGPYKPTTVLVQAVAATDDSLAIFEPTTVETPMNMSPENKAHFQAEKEAIHLILTGIRDKIYSTIDACQTAQEMWEAIKRLQQGKEIAKPYTPPSETDSKEDNDLEQAQRDKDMQKNLALIAKYFKKIYKPTNNNLKTSSNSRNKNVDMTPRYKNDNQSRHFGNQRTVNVVGARENAGSPVVQQSGIQCFNCKEFGHFAKECRKPKRVKDSVYHKEKMLLCKQDEQGTDSEPLEQNDQNDVESDDERVALANLIANLKFDDSCLVALQNKQIEFEKYKAFNDRTIDYGKLERKLNETLGQLAYKDIEIKEGLKTKAYEISVVKEKHDELMKQSLLTKSHYDGLVKQKTKVITDLKLREEHDIDKMLSMEKQLKFLNEVVYKRGQLIQTIHMMASKVPIYNGRPTFANPRYLKQAQLEIPCLYAFPYDQSTHANRLIPDGEETLALERKSRSKLNKDLAQQVKHDTVWNEKASNVFRKEREQYFEIQDLKAQLQDKNIAISELKKLIEKGKGKSVETKFDKPSVVRQPNAQRIPKPSVLGKVA